MLDWRASSVREASSSTFGCLISRELAKGSPLMSGSHVITVDNFMVSVSQQDSFPHVPVDSQEIRDRSGREAYSPIIFNGVHDLHRLLRLALHSTLLWYNELLFKY